MASRIFNAKPTPHGHCAPPCRHMDIPAFDDVAKDGDYTITELAEIKIVQAYFGPRSGCSKEGASSSPSGRSPVPSPGCRSVRNPGGHDRNLYPDASRPKGEDRGQSEMLFDESRKSSPWCPFDRNPAEEAPGAAINWLALGPAPSTDGGSRCPLNRGSRPENRKTRLGLPESPRSGFSPGAAAPSALPRIVAPQMRFKFFLLLKGRGIHLDKAKALKPGSRQGPVRAGSDLINTAKDLESGVAARRSAPWGMTSFSKPSGRPGLLQGRHDDVPAGNCDLPPARPTTNYPAGGAANPCQFVLRGPPCSLPIDAAAAGKSRYFPAEQVFAHAKERAAECIRSLFLSMPELKPGRAATRQT